jgi:hypothetical protein
MFFIPGWLISILTFPGVIVHEIAHQLFCRLFRVAVLNVCYFRIGNPAGFVVHEHPRKASHHLWIGIGPFFLNTILGALIALPGAIPVLQFESGSLLDWFFVWLGVSIAMHAFPSTGDAQSIWQGVQSPETPLAARIIAAPVVGIIYLGAFGSMVWLDAVYGVGVAMLLPKLLVWVLA